MPKNKNAIIHSNSTNHIKPSNLKENNYKIININVNNLIINNNIKGYNNKNNNDNININKNNNNKVFSRLGNNIIDGKNILNNEIKNNKIQKKGIRGLSNPKGLKRKLLKGLYNPLSNIQEVIDNLMEVTKCSPPSLDNNLNLNRINPITEEIKANNNGNDNDNNNDKLNEKKNNNKDNQIDINIEEKYIEIHFNLWEIMINMELNAENKLGLSNQMNKILSLIEKYFFSNNNNIIICDIFINKELNYIYKKIIKIYFILITYIKFLLLDFNFETTIKSNIKRLLSLINESLLYILSSHVFIKDNLQENNSCSKIKNEFIEIYYKIIKNKKLKKLKTEQINSFCDNINKNLETTISSIKQFSNNFFKIGYFNPIHCIFFDIFRLIENYKIEDITNIIINNILFYILKSNQNNKKSTPKLISFNIGNTLEGLGFLNVPSPYLNKLPLEKEKLTYTLVLDLDETLIHFFYTPSGGTFLIRPFCLKFLEEMSKTYEIIIFTAALKDYADSILDIIDPEKKLINYRLYRQHISLCGINFCKDLSKIGRDLNRTLIVDNLEDNFKLQPNNGIPILTWIDDMKDTQLYEFCKMLKELWSKKPDDVRPIIKKFKEDLNKKMRNNMNINPYKGVDINKYL